MKKRKVMIAALAMCLLSACGKSEAVYMDNVDAEEAQKDVTLQESSSDANEEIVIGKEYILNTDNYDSNYLESFKEISECEYQSNLMSNAIIIPFEEYQEGVLVAVYDNPDTKGNSWYLSEDGYLRIDTLEGYDEIDEWADYGEAHLYTENFNLEFDTQSSLHESISQEEINSNLYRFVDQIYDTTYEYYSVANYSNLGFYDDKMTVSLYYDNEEASYMKKLADECFSWITWYYVENGDLTKAKNIMSDEQEDISKYAHLQEVVCNELVKFGIKIDSPQFVYKVEDAHVTIETEKCHHEFYLDSFGKSIAGSVEEYIEHYEYYGKMGELDIFLHKNDTLQFMVLYKDTLVWYTFSWTLDNNFTQDEAVALIFELYR
ncbi:MAG: hypothetical protein E7290_03020 [Lachnospiraceae bacterium]|nr:hypothetical protein [Lachnospiraceae bacterium]